HPRLRRYEDGHRALGDRRAQPPRRRGRGAHEPDSRRDRRAGQEAHRRAVARPAATTTATTTTATAATASDRRCQRPSQRLGPPISWSPEVTATAASSARNTAASTRRPAHHSPRLTSAMPTAAIDEQIEWAVTAAFSASVNA